jgi:hypothetical protein
MDLIETVCQAALESVRGHGGESAHWLAEAMTAAAAVLDEMARADDPTWGWLPGRILRW